MYSSKFSREWSSCLQSSLSQTLYCNFSASGELTHLLDQIMKKGELNIAVHFLFFCMHCRPIIFIYIVFLYAHIADLWSMHAYVLLLDRTCEWLIVVSQNLFNWYWSCQTSKLVTSPTGRNDEELVEKYHSVAEFAAGGKGEMSLRENEVVTVIEKNTTGL